MHPYYNVILIPSYCEHNPQHLLVNIYFFSYNICTTLFDFTIGEINAIKNGVDQWIVIVFYNSVTIKLFCASNNSCTLNFLSLREVHFSVDYMIGDRIFKCSITIRINWISIIWRLLWIFLRLIFIRDIFFRDRLLWIRHISPNFLLNNTIK